MLFVTIFTDYVVADLESNQFVIGMTVYTVYRKPMVIRMCPYIPVDHDDESSAYSTLLLHIPWPVGGEKMILRGHDNAVDALHELSSTDGVATTKHTRAYFERMKFTDGVMHNVGESDAIYNDSEVVHDHTLDDSGSGSDGGEDEQLDDIFGVVSALESNVSDHTTNSTSMDVVHSTINDDVVRMWMIICISIWRKCNVITKCASSLCP